VNTFMEIEPELPRDRITYRDGQLLTARDLRDDKRRDDRLRWLHTRYVHDTWGIALGYEVQGSGGDDAVVVGPGYAVDKAGRDILLAETVRVAVPSVSGPVKLVLVASYDRDSAFHKLRNATGLCSDGSNLHNERPILAWLQSGEARFGLQVPLASVTVANGKISGPLDFRVRRKARRSVRSRIAWGSAKLSREVGRFIATGVSWVNDTVDTKEAGFTRTPCYFVTLHGAPSTWPAETSPDHFGHPMIFISDAAVDHFTYLIVTIDRLPEGVPPDPVWTVRWFGFEPITGCPPVLKLKHISDIRHLLTSFANEAHQ